MPLTGPKIPLITRTQRDWLPEPVPAVDGAVPPEPDPVVAPVALDVEALGDMSDVRIACRASRRALIAAWRSLRSSALSALSRWRSIRSRR